jgi:hypothetical protein
MQFSKGATFEKLSIEALYQCDKGLWLMQVPPLVNLNEKYKWRKGSASA